MTLRLDLMTAQYSRCAQGALGSCSMFLQLGTLFLSHLCFKRDVRVAGEKLSGENDDRQGSG